jgi:hypothetical protein
MDANNVDQKGGGSHALSGYEYQIDVSVWLALDLLLASKLSDEVTLEPLSQEDLEAVIEDSDPGPVRAVMSVSSYQLVVQAKLRTGDAWTVHSIRSLLNHGKTRPSVASRLASANIRYALVTSAAVNGVARKLSVRRAGNWPSPASMPVSLSKELPPNAAGRVAILANQDDDRLNTYMKTLLTENFRVPTSRWEACRDQLREAARIRIRGGGSGQWTRAEIELTIRQHDGYIASSPELEHYVHPINWSELRSAIANRHGALIVGQSGTGKTLASRKLYEELRTEIPGLTRLAITRGPQQLRDDQTLGPVLFDIEDPWGRYDFDPDGRPWNDQLSRFFAHASPDRMVVATSRLDVATAAGALENVRPWIVILEAEHYGDLERSQLYRTRIDTLPRGLQSLAQQREAAVLAELATPLEIQKFFDALPTLDASELKNPDGYIRNAIRKAHQDSIERTVIDQIEGRNDIRAAAVIWGLLKAYERLSLQALRNIEELLADREKEFERGVGPLVGFFVAARNLRQTDASVVYYHPRVESGIEQALLRHDLLARRTLKLLIDILVSMDGPDQIWGTSGSTRLIAATARLSSLRPSTSPGTQEKIDNWLTQEVAKNGKEFEHTLRLAAAAGSANSAVSEVSRFLLHRPGPEWYDLGRWQPPAHDAAWYARLRADPSTRPLLESFIAQVLPTDRDDYGAQFVPEVERLAPDLSGAFLEAAAVAVNYGVLRSADTIAAGALVDVDRFEPIVDKAVEMLTPSPGGQEEAEKVRLALANDEYGEQYAQHVQENDEGYTAQEFLEAYVDRVREKGDWERLRRHRHRDRLRFYWLRALGKSKNPDEAEIAGAFASCFGQSDEEYLWYALAKSWDPKFLPTLTDRVINGHMEREVRVAALSCLVQCAPKQLLAVGETLLSQGRRSRLTEIALELVNYRYWYPPGSDEKPTPSITETSAVTLPAPYSEIAQAAVALRKKETPVLSEAAREVITSVIAENVEHRLFRISIDPFVAVPADDDIRWLLANSTESDVAVQAIEAAIRRGMAGEIQSSLGHHFAHVVSRALTAVAGPLPAPLPQHLLALSKSKGSPIRKALVALLESKPHSAHVPVLLELVDDEWSIGLDPSGADEDYPIARAAVRALETSGPLSLATGEHLYKRAIDTRDRQLRYDLFALIAGSPSLAPMQERLLNLSLRPGQSEMSRLAAGALLRKHQYLLPTVVARLSAEALLTASAAVALRLALIVSAQGEIGTVRAIAQELATSAGRRVLLVLIAAVLVERDQQAAQSVTTMLPNPHPAVAWVLKGGSGQLGENALDDLGDALTVAQVMRWIESLRGP